MNVRYPLFVTLLLLQLFAGCEDLLPVYEPPADVFAVEMLRHDSTAVIFYSSRLNDTLVLYRSFGNDFDFIRLVYFPNNTTLFQGLPNYFTTEFVIENIYEETIQTKPNVNGTWEIWPIDDPSIRFTLKLGNTILDGSPLYSSTTQFLTIDPGQQLHFSLRWNFRMDNNKFIHKYCGVPNGSVLNNSFKLMKYPLTKMAMRLSIQLTSDSKVYMIERNFTLDLRNKLHEPPN